MSNKKFWSTVRPFLTNTDGMSNDFISIGKDGDLISSKFDLPKPTASDINKIIKSSDTSKATGPDGIPAKPAQMLANVID